MTHTVLAFLYLFVSVESVAIQIASLVRLRGAARDPLSRTLRRTVLTRVVVMTTYVGVGVGNILYQATLSVPALVVFTAVALVWQANSVVDARAYARHNGNRESIGAKIKRWHDSQQDW